MADDRLIIAEGIGKVYHPHDGRESLLQNALLRLIGRARRRKWIAALSDVTFSVERGEWLAVIGANGAGKTTLLKIIAGIARPSAGRIEVRAPIATQFALGAGFHPYLSGRENVFLEGTILGMTNAEVRSRLTRILDFAGLDAAIDRPVWTYSVGMVARLGFAVTAYAQPQLLVLDEALSGGDAAFRDRCDALFRDLRARGATVVVVSHSMKDLVRLCDRALWLERGRVRAEGPTAATISRYQGFVARGGREDGAPQPGVQ
jgi:ABC-type polysaccharide/polyol phosphate transport system ATPase subunit